MQKLCKSKQSSRLFPSNDTATLVFNSTFLSINICVDNLFVHLTLVICQKYLIFTSYMRIFSILTEQDISYDFAEFLLNVYYFTSFHVCLMWRNTRVQNLLGYTG